jgi:hypothetical protein
MESSNPSIWIRSIRICMRCNQTWKGSLFPVCAEPRRLPPSPDAPEEPLLLSPCGPGERTGQFLRINIAVPRLPPEGRRG